MFILNEENKSINLGKISLYIKDEKDIMFFVLDLETENDYDFKCFPLKYMEKRNVNLVELMIDEKYLLRMPVNWYILIGDKVSYDKLEFISVQDIMTEEHTCFSINPITSYIPKWMSIKAINMYPNIEWISPKLKNHHYLVYPLSEGSSPNCIIVCPETNKVNVSLDIGDIF